MGAIDDEDKKPKAAEDARRETASGLSASDIQAGGGSSGAELARLSEDGQAGRQGREPGSHHLAHEASPLSRGERYDQEQGGGRGPDSVD
jgi:hypothetical protein